MTTSYQTHSHSSMRRSNIRPSRRTRPSSPPPTNNKGIKIRFGQSLTPPPSMNKPISILKKRRQPNVDRFNENVPDWQQPSDLKFVPTRPLYSPVHTPPRLRTLITPPGVEPYRNVYNLRKYGSPLPALDDWQPPPLSLDTWGINPIDYRLSSNLNLIRRYPSPLSHYGLGGSPLHKQKKSYIVVPRLSSVGNSPMNGGGGTFTLPPRPIQPTHIPDSQFTYLERIHSFGPSILQRESSDYVYVRRNEAFANRYIDDFIGRCIEDQLIPDILLEVIGEIDRENKAHGSKSYKVEVDRYYAELNSRIHRQTEDHTQLFSDQWIRELDYQRPPLPSSQIDSNLSLLKPLDFREVPPVRKTTTRLRFKDLPADVQARLLADVNQDLIDFEVENMITELSGQTVGVKLQNVPVINDTTRHIYNEIESEVIRETMRDTAYDTLYSQRNQVDQVQFNSIEKHAENKLLDSLCLDQLLGRYIQQNGSTADVDDLSRLLDASILEVLTYQYQDIREDRSRTLDNYALRKFHLNSFMNITMDLLLTELSASLIEDMKDVDEQERKTF